MKRGSSASISSQGQSALAAAIKVNKANFRDWALGDVAVAEHGFGQGGGDDDEFALAVFDGILEVPQFAGHLALLNL
jgi:hypothetical protein